MRETFFEWGMGILVEVIMEENSVNRETIDFKVVFFFILYNENFNYFTSKS